MRIRQTRFVSQRPRGLVRKQEMERFIRIKERTARGSQANEKGGTQYQKCNPMVMSSERDLLTLLRFESALHTLCVIHQEMKIT